jgi:hypothetical protein
MDLIEQFYKELDEALNAPVKYHCPYDLSLPNDWEDVSKRCAALGIDLKKFTEWDWP